MRVLGIDPGTGILGFGVIEVLNNNPKLVDGGVIRTKPTEPDDERLMTIYKEINSIIKNQKPKVMAVEKLFFAQNVTTAMTVAQARGVILLCGRQNNLELFEYTPLEIKQALAGYGRADKKQIQEMVKLLLGLKTVPKPDDCADALAAALCHVQTNQNYNLRNNMG